MSAKRLPVLLGSQCRISAFAWMSSQATASANGPSGDVLQFEEEATGFPAGFSFIQRNQVMIWDIVKIGEVSHWLPVSADFSWRMGDGSLTRAAAVYKNHRHFEAASNVTFQ